MATENARRIIMPVEYVRSGSLINSSPMPEKSTISSNSSAVRLRVKPSSAAFNVTFSSPVKSG